MQISRHWRMNAQRYRLEGVRYSDGSVSVVNRPTSPESHSQNGQIPDSKEVIEFENIIHQEALSPSPGKERR
jgi:hypothetical protein